MSTCNTNWIPVVFFI